MIPTNKIQYLAGLMVLVFKGDSPITQTEEDLMMKAWNALCTSEDLTSIQYAHRFVGARIVGIVQAADDQRANQLVSAIGVVDDVIAELHDILEAK